MSGRSTQRISPPPRSPKLLILRFAVTIAVIAVAILFLAFIKDHNDCSEDSSNEREIAAKRLQELFTATGRKHLSELVDSADSTVALHALWELAKGDSKKTDHFVDQLENRLNVTSPAWWRESVKNIRVYAGNCHYVPDVDPTKLLQCSKLVHGNYGITAHPDTAGFPFEMSVSDRTEQQLLWSTEVWAAGRSGLAGSGVHRIELLVSSDCVFVFGTESHGAYVEGFHLTDGKPVIRFCSCYWFNFSETWQL